MKPDRGAVEHAFHIILYYIDTIDNIHKYTQDQVRLHYTHFDFVAVTLPMGRINRTNELNTNVYTVYFENRK